MITFLTRCHPDRANMREKCMKSVREQTSKDCEHILIGNYQVNGSVEANRLFGQYAHCPRSAYVQILDDDCRLVKNSWVEEFTLLIDNLETAPPVFFVKMTRPGYPQDIPINWPPEKGSIDGACVVARRDVFMKHISKFSETNTGDWDYIQSILEEHGDDAIVINVVIVEAMMVGEGAPEGSLQGACL